MRGCVAKSNIKVFKLHPFLGSKGISLGRPLKHNNNMVKNTNDFAHLGAFESESGEVVWVLFVPTESQKRKLLGSS